MRSQRRGFLPLVLVLSLCAGVIAVAEFGGSRANAADDAVADAKTFTVTHICEAQELRALHGDDITIKPDKYHNQPWPSLEACRSHDAAWDEDAPGPQQPIPFSHAHHAGLWQIDCQYCHSGTDRSRAAGVPSVELCMGCHNQFSPLYDELEGIQILKEHWNERKPIEWAQIHRLPEHVKFRHNRHVAAGVECQQCHGPVERLDKLYLVPDTKWWAYGLPTQKLEMGWCIKCHRENEVSQDCLTCHY